MTNLLNYFIDKALSSSKSVMTLAKEMVNLAAEVKSIKESLAMVIHTVQIHQIAFDELLRETQNDIPPKLEIDFKDKKNDKKEKPN